MNIPNKCPSCEGKIIVTELYCEECKTSIKGKFNLGSFDFLEKDEIEFIKVFLSCHGNIKLVEKSLGISYPTVKSKLNSIVSKLGIEDYDVDFKTKKAEILEKLERREITAQDAVKMIRDLKK